MVSRNVNGVFAKRSKNGTENKNVNKFENYPLPYWEEGDFLKFAVQVVVMPEAHYIFEKFAHTINA